MSEHPLVTIVVPAQNEEADVARAIGCVVAQTYPVEKLELLVVDGGSTDRTREVVAESLSGSALRWRIIENHGGTTPGNLNAGLAQASGMYLCRVDCRSLLPPTYIESCVRTLDENPGVMVTGGAQVAVHRDLSALSVGIARGLNNRYAMGGSRYRSGAESGPTDTVYLGFFRTSQLLEAGGWDEAMLSNQDFELNRRMAQEGEIWFDGSLAVGYLPRSSLSELWQQYHRFGRWKVRYWRHTGDRPLPRQQKVLVAPLLALAGTAVILAWGRPRGYRLVTRALAVSSVATSGIVAVEIAGTKEPVATPGGHAVGGAALVAVSVGWLSGVFREAVVGKRLG